MDNNEAIRRSGWRGVVFDGPLRIVIAFVLMIAGFSVANLFTEAVEAYRGALYFLLVTFCLLPFIVFTSIVFHHRLLWVPVHMIVFSILVACGDWAIVATAGNGNAPNLLYLLPLALCASFVASTVDRALGLNKQAHSP